MNDDALKPDTQDIVFDEIFPHAPDAIWKVMTNGELMGRWLMPAIGFEPVQGKHFTFPTKPDGEWDGVIRCQVLEAIPNERLVYTWKSGYETNSGYVSRLDTVVSWTFSKVAGGTRICLVHSGFIMPKNLSVFQNVSQGWSKIVPKLIAIVAEDLSPKTRDMP